MLGTAGRTPRVLEVASFFTVGTGAVEREGVRKMRFCLVFLGRAVGRPGYFGFYGILEVDPFFHPPFPLPCWAALPVWPFPHTHPRSDRQGWLWTACRLLDQVAAVIQWGNTPGVVLARQRTSEDADPGGACTIATFWRRYGCL